MLLDRILILIIAATALYSCDNGQQGLTIPDPPHHNTPDIPGTPGGKDDHGPTKPLEFYSISCGPGEDASTSMCISWAVDSTKVGSSVQYTKVSDTNWERATTVKPEQNYYCTVFDGIWSKSPSGDFYEKAKFIKYGATLKSLDPDTDYKYVIKGDDGSKSREGTFRTAGASIWSCAIISDFHSYTPLPKRLISAMGIIDKMEEKDPSLDWVLSPGDVVAWGGSYSFWKRLFEEENFVNHMWARVNGNDDNWTREANEVTNDFDIPNHFFKGTSYYPQNGYGDELGVCYHFRYGNTLFVMLNSEDMENGNNEYKDAVAWTKKVVNEARSSANPPVFVVVLMHIEWFQGTDGKAAKYNSWRKVFDELNVNLAIAGDNHVYVRTYPLYNDKVITDGSCGTVYLQTPASDNDRGRSLSSGDPANKEKIAFRWTEGSHSIGAVHMEVNGKKMDLQLINRNGEVLDSVRLTGK